MAAGDIILTGTISTSADSDVYPTHKAELCLGGYRSVADIATRDAIPAQRREEGMAVYVVADGKKYILKGGTDNTNWVEDAGGGADGTTFIPSVSDAGVISWTNDGGKPNPDPVNIMGPKGDDGSAGVNGISYGPDDVRHELTEEHVVGYLNGKPVYEKTFVTQTASTTSGTVIDLSSYNIDTFLSMTGFLFSSAKQYIPVGYTSSSVSFSLFYEQNVIKQQVYSSFVNRPCNITISYTKTTD